MTAFYPKYKTLIYYAAAMAAVMFVLRWLEFRLLVIDHSFEIYAGLIALIFTALGVWVATKLSRPKTNTIVIEKEVASEFAFNQAECERLNISKRELEVLQLMASGLSNSEIAERMFVSLNTIKTHAANLFDKLEVRRRTQAVERAKRLNLLP